MKYNNDQDYRALNEIWDAITEQNRQIEDLACRLEELAYRLEESDERLKNTQN